MIILTTLVYIIISYMRWMFGYTSIYRSVKMTWFQRETRGAHISKSSKASLPSSANKSNRCSKKHID